MVKISAIDFPRSPGTIELIAAVPACRLHRDRHDVVDEQRHRGDLRDVRGPKFSRATT